VIELLDDQAAALTAKAAADGLAQILYGFKDSQSSAEDQSSASPVESGPANMLQESVRIRACEPLLSPLGG
jgi:hypothetical protein